MNLKKNNIKLLSVCNKILSKCRDTIGHNNMLYIQRIYGKGLDKYLSRINALGFTNYDRVLDAGCGFGQWSLALSHSNKLVDSCDISSTRISFLNSMTKELGVSNINTCESSLERLPYSDNTFDVVFCYGVIFLTPWRESIRELTRVLKPNGKLYISANEVGWYLFLWNTEHNKANDYDPKLVASKAFSETLSYDRDGVFKEGMNIIISMEQIRDELYKLGFIYIQVSNEGGLHLNLDADKPKPFFSGDLNGKPNVYEVVGTK